MRCGRVPLSDVGGSTVVGAEARADGDSVVSSVRGRLIALPVVPGEVEVDCSKGVVFISDRLTILLTGSETRAFFEGVDEGARLSQRADRLEGGVKAGVSVAAAELGLGK